MTAKRRWVGLIAATVTAGLLLSGCAGAGDTPKGSSAAGGEPAKGGTVHMLQNADFSYLDPARGWDGGVNAFYRLLYRGLTMQAAGDAKDPNAIVPDLAASLGKPSSDGMTWTYRLKDDLQSWLDRKTQCFRKMAGCRSKVTVLCQSPSRVATWNRIIIAFRHSTRWKFGILSKRTRAYDTYIPCNPPKKVWLRCQVMLRSGN